MALDGGVAASRIWLGKYGEGSAAMKACIAGLVVAGVVVWMTRREKKEGIRMVLPPGPRGWPVIGHIHLLGKAPHLSLMNLAKKYGPIMSLRLGSVYAVVVSSPDIAREVLKTQDHLFASRPQSLSGEVFFWNYQDLAFAPLNTHFRIMRRLCSEELLTSKCLDKRQDIRREEILRVVQSLLVDSREGKPLRVDLRLHEMMFNNIARMLYNRTFYGQKTVGTYSSGDRKDFHQLGLEWATLAAGFIPGDFFPCLRKLDLGGNEAAFWRIRGEFDQFMSIILEEHRHKLKSPKDESQRAYFVDVLLSEQEANVNGKGLTDVQIKGLLQDLMIGGTDSASTQTQWALAELMRHPEIREKVCAELDEAVGRTRLVEESDLEKLPYLHAVVRESFRLHIPAPLLAPHQSLTATKVGGYDIPSDTRVMVNVYAMARDPQLWDDPLDFNPQRFLGSPIDLRGQHFEFLPFGSGRRMCPGMNLGLLMVELTLAQLLHTCEFSLPQGMEPGDVDVTELLGVVLALAHPLKLLASPRLPSHVYAEASIAI